MKDKIDEQILNSAEVRDTVRILKINKNTVISHLKKVSKQVNPYLLDFNFGRQRTRVNENLKIIFHSNFQI